MTKALVTLGVGTHEELLDIALPSFEAFCDLHDYDLLVAPPIDSPRPPSWWKVPVLLAALDEYDEALWVDADCVITDPTEDLDVPAVAWQAMVEHHTGDGAVPNCAVWLVRQPMRPFLERAWGMVEYINHGWWEQAAMIHLMGYRGRPSVRRVPTELHDRTHFLDSGWNVHPWDVQRSEHVRLMHATMRQNPARVMRVWADAAARLVTA